MYFCSVKELIRNIASQLTAAYSEDEAEEMAWWILEETTALSRTQLLCGCKDTTNFPKKQEISEIISRLLHFEPIQYIFGRTFWYGLDLALTPATLIPRPETAELVERINAKMPNDRMLHVLDIGTGSGCIAIALKKKHPSWTVTGIDISAEAIAVARENACRNKVEVEFFQMDILSDEIGRNHPSPITSHQYDIVVSNPPYICEHEKSQMRRNVLDYEPSAALFVPDDDPLLFYRRIAKLHLGRHLFFEINEAYPEEMKSLLSSLRYTGIQCIKDQYGKARIIEARSLE